MHTSLVTLPIDVHFTNQDDMCQQLNLAVRKELRNNKSVDGFKSTRVQTFIRYGRIVEQSQFKRFVESPQSLFELFTKNGYEIKWSPNHGQTFRMIRPSTADNISVSPDSIAILLGFAVEFKREDLAMTGMPATSLQEGALIQDVRFTWDPVESKIRADLFWLDSQGEKLEVEMSPAFQEITNLPPLMSAIRQPSVYVPGQPIVYKIPTDPYDWTNIGSVQSYVESSKPLVFNDVYFTSRFSQAYLNCSLVDRVTIGSVQRQLLEVIPLQIANYQHRSGLSPPMYNHEPKNLKYRPLNQGNITSIKFTIEDEHGQPLPLDPKGTSVVTIRFHRK
jgi:hypothetical protein